jgi:hypothetical protein
LLKKQFGMDQAWQNKSNYKAKKTVIGGKIGV